MSCLTIFRSLARAVRIVFTGIGAREFLPRSSRSVYEQTPARSVDRFSSFFPLFGKKRTSGLNIRWIFDTLVIFERSKFSDCGSFALFLIEIFFLSSHSFGWENDYQCFFSFNFFFSFECDFFIRNYTPKCSSMSCLLYLSIVRILSSVCVHLFISNWCLLIFLHNPFTSISYHRISISVTLSKVLRFISIDFITEFWLIKATLGYSAHISLSQRNRLLLFFQTKFSRFLLPYIFLSIQRISRLNVFPVKVCILSDRNLFIFFLPTKRVVSHCAWHPIWIRHATDNQNRYLYWCWRWSKVRFLSTSPTCLLFGFDFVALLHSRYVHAHMQVGLFSVFVCLVPLICSLVGYRFFHACFTPLHTITNRNRTYREVCSSFFRYPIIISLFVTHTTFFLLI